jgi:hypothetical protein
MEMAARTKTRKGKRYQDRDGKPIIPYFQCENKHRRRLLLY